jgi:hypothetical protein
MQRKAVQSKPPQKKPKRNPHRRRNDDKELRLFLHIQISIPSHINPSSSNVISLFSSSSDRVLPDVAFGYFWFSSIGDSQRNAPFVSPLWPLAFGT